MPPKKNDKGGGSKPAVDKTFGMKNKGGGKAKKQIAVIQQQQQQTGKSKEQLAKEKQKEAEKKAKAEAEKLLKQETAMMTIIQPKVPFGVDPKTIVCEYWRHGRCDKGNRCKFAHSEDAGRKVQKKDLYVDSRDQAKEEKEKDTMDKWDREKLDKVILSKHGNPKTTTDKVCKFFLEAVEAGKYGWFWECQNGSSCIYRHALPPGYVLKSVKKEQEALEKANEISLEEFLEVERHKLGKELTPVTAETFAKWKKERVDKKTAEEEAVKNKKEKQAALNKLAGLSGREMFELNPEMYADDDADDDEEGEFDMRQYLANWQQDRQSDDEGHDALSEDEDYDSDAAKAQREDDDDDEEEEDDGAGPSSRPMENGSAHGKQGSELAEGMDKLSVNGDEGKEKGKQKAET